MLIIFPTRTRRVTRAAYKRFTANYSALSTGVGVHAIPRLMTSPRLEDVQTSRQAINRCYCSRNKMNVSRNIQGAFHKSQCPPRLQHGVSILCTSRMPLALSHLFNPAATAVFITSNDHLRTGVCVRNEENSHHSNTERYRTNTLLHGDPVGRTV